MDWRGWGCGSEVKNNCSSCRGLRLTVACNSTSGIQPLLAFSVTGTRTGTSTEIVTDVHTFTLQKWAGRKASFPIFIYPTWYQLRQVAKLQPTTVRRS